MSPGSVKPIIESTRSTTEPLDAQKESEEVARNLQQPFSLDVDMMKLKMARVYQLREALETGGVRVQLRALYCLLQMNLDPCIITSTGIMNQVFEIAKGSVPECRKLASAVLKCWCS